MGWTNLQTFVLDYLLGYQDLVEISGNLTALKSFPKVAWLGGSNIAYQNNAFALVTDGVYVEIDATNLGGLTFELHFMGSVTAADTGSVELVTNPGGSNTVVSTTTFTNTTIALVKSAAITLTAGVN